MNTLPQTQSFTRRQTLQLFATGAASLAVVTAAPVFANAGQAGNRLSDSFGSKPQQSENVELSAPFVLSF